MADDDEVLALRRRGGEQITQRLRTPLVLARRDHQPAFGDIHRGRDFANVEELGSLLGPVELTGDDIVAPDLARAARRAQRCGANEYGIKAISTSIENATNRGSDRSYSAPVVTLPINQPLP